MSIGKIFGVGSSTDSNRVLSGIENIGPYNIFFDQYIVERVMVGTFGYKLQQELSTPWWSTAGHRHGKHTKNIALKNTHYPIILREKNYVLPKNIGSGIGYPSDTAYGPP